MTDQSDYEIAYRREKMARNDAEAILETKTRELYELNEALVSANVTLLTQQEQLVQTEKLASLGSLSAGIAHEINNPLAFVSSNINTLNKYAELYIGLTSLLLAIDEPLPLPIASKLQEIQEGKRNIGYIINDTRLIFTEVKDGLERVRDIVASLKTFARSNPGDRADADINQAVNDALKILDSELKYRCKIDVQLKPLPPIYCNISEVGQIFINIIMNAYHAVGEDGVIKVRSDSGDDIRVTIEDNGKGIPDDVLPNIFDPFFTNKPLGEGTGLGLSVSHGIIENLGGRIEVESKVGVGTRFIIIFPIKQRTEVRP